MAGIISAIFHKIIAAPKTIRIKPHITFIAPIWNKKSLSESPQYDTLSHGKKGFKNISRPPTRPAILSGSLFISPTMSFGTIPILPKP